MAASERVVLPRAARLPALAVLAVTAALLVPLALAWACGPQAGLYPNKSTYAPGESGTISGVNFTPGLAFTIDVAETGQTLASVTVPDTGSFTVAFTAPTATQTYTIVANGVDASGLNIRSPGTPITVAVPQPQEPAPGEAPAGTGTPAGAPAAGAPAQSGPAARAPETSSRQTSGRTTSSTQLRDPAAPRARRSAPVIPATTQPAAGEGTVFTGSVPPAVSTPQAARTPAAANARRPAATERPSESTAQTSAWGGLSSASDPALVPSGSFPATGGGDATAKTLSVLLLSLGLAALVGGVGISEARRRRSRAD